MAEADTGKLVELLHAADAARVSAEAECTALRRRAERAEADERVASARAAALPWSQRFARALDELFWPLVALGVFGLIAAVILAPSTPTVDRCEIRVTDIAVFDSAGRFALTVDGNKCATQKRARLYKKGFGGNLDALADFQTIDEALEGATKLGCQVGTKGTK
jgi:hypothetical protein